MPALFASSFPRIHKHLVMLRGLVCFHLAHGQVLDLVVVENVSILVSVFYPLLAVDDLKGDVVGRGGGANGAQFAVLM